MSIVANCHSRCRRRLLDLELQWRWRAVRRRRLGTQHTLRFSIRTDIHIIFNSGDINRMSAASECEEACRLIG